jgi:hypothetical protein
MFEVIHPPSCPDAVDDADNKTCAGSISGESLKSFRPSQFGMIRIAGHNGYFYANTKGKNNMLELILNQEQYNKHEQPGHIIRREETEMSLKNSQNETRVENSDDNGREKGQVEAKCLPEIGTKDSTISLNRNRFENGNTSCRKEQVSSSSISKKISTPSKVDSSCIARSTTGHVSHADEESTSQPNVFLQLSRNPTGSTAMSTNYKQLHCAQLSPASPNNANLFSSPSEESCQSPMSILSSQKKKAYSITRRVSSLRRSGHVKSSKSSSSLELGSKPSDGAVMMCSNEKSCLSPSSVASTRNQMAMKIRRRKMRDSRRLGAHQKENDLSLTRHLSLMGDSRENRALLSVSLEASNHCRITDTRSDDNAEHKKNGEDTPRLATFLRRHRSANPSVSSRWSSSNTTPLIRNARPNERPDSGARQHVDDSDGKGNANRISRNLQITENTITQGISDDIIMSGSDRVAKQDRILNTDTNGSMIEHTKNEMISAREFVPTRASRTACDRKLVISLENGEHLSVINGYSMKSCKSRASSVLSFLRSKHNPSFRFAKTSKGRLIGSPSAMIATDTTDQLLHANKSEENLLEAAMHDILAVDTHDDLTEEPTDRGQIPFEVRVLEQEETSILSILSPKEKHEHAVTQSYPSSNEKQERADILPIHALNQKVEHVNSPSLPPTPGLTEAMSETTIDKGTLAELRNELEKKLEYHVDNLSSPNQMRGWHACGFDFNFGKCFSF